MYVFQESHSTHHSALLCVLSSHPPPSRKFLEKSSDGGVLSGWKCKNRFVLIWIPNARYICVQGGIRYHKVSPRPPRKLLLLYETNKQDTKEESPYACPAWFFVDKTGGGKAQKRRAMHASTYLYMEAKLSTTEICSQVTTVVVVHTCMPPLLSDKVGSEFHPTRAICYLTVSVNIRYGCTRYSITPFEASLDAINSMEGKNVEPKTKMTAS